MPAPTCKKQVQSFIGMVNYLSKFSVRLLELVEPIRELSKDKLPFNWVPEHQEAFKQMKKEIARASILAYYNPRKQTVLQTDASIKWLGACLLQDEKLVYFASKTLTEAQKGYVAIEIESLAVAWAMGEVSPLLVCKLLCIGNWPETIRSYLIQKPQASTSTATNNLNENLSISPHCPFYTRCHQSTCWLLVKIGRSERYN